MPDLVRELGEEIETTGLCGGDALLGVEVSERVVVGEHDSVNVL